MKKIALLILSLYTCFSSLFYSCNSTNENNHLPTPVIKCGTARMSGRFIGYNDLKKNERFNSIYTYMSYPLTGRTERIKIDIKDDETFSLEIPLETSSSLGYIQFADYFYVFALISGKETMFNLSFKNKKLQIKGLNGPNFLFGDTDPWYDALSEALGAEPLSISAWGHYNMDTLKHFMADPKEYIPFALKYDLGNRLRILRKGNKIPEKALDIFDCEVKLMRIPQFINFGGDIWNMYKTFYQIENKKELNNEIEENELDSATYIPPQPDISYWIFLKEFDLKNPTYLYTQKYSYIIQMLLENETLSIPPIGECLLDDWMKQTKNILAGLVGFDEEMFYDALLCNAYSKQFIDEMKPLSNKQIQNIKNYYKGAEVEKILLRENERIAKLNINRLETIVNETPAVKKEKLIESIISKYPGKIVVVDYWATWCAPCLEAISESHEMKTNYIGKDIVFVYITSESSPIKTWKLKIKGIGGEHYYLTQEEWVYLLDSHGFRGIPTYQFYDKKGILQEQFTGSLHIQGMQKKIEKMLLT